MRLRRVANSVERVGCLASCRHAARRLNAHAAFVSGRSLSSALWKMRSYAGVAHTAAYSHRLILSRLLSSTRRAGVLLPTSLSTMWSSRAKLRDRVLPLPATQCARRFKHDYSFSGFADTGDTKDSLDNAALFPEDDMTLHSELASMLSGHGEATMETDNDGSSTHLDDDRGASNMDDANFCHVSATHTTANQKPYDKTEKMSIELERLERPPSRFDLLSNSMVYRWTTTARYARRISGPMREWASELKYRTGVHLELEVNDPDRLLLSPAEGGYATADDVELTVYLFGSERGVFNCHKLMESALVLEPAYVRLGVFRRVPNPTPDGASQRGEVEWLLLRRLNRDLRPPDIPPISLKLPGKWTLLYENYQEAAIRTLWEETGITVEPNSVFPTARLLPMSPMYYWRVPVHYFIAEVPYTTNVLGPQVALNSYMHDWDVSLLRQSPDPIDRVWAQTANPQTGCAWLRGGLIDELQQPLRGSNYMSTRYTPPPFTNLSSVVGLGESSEVSSSGTGVEGVDYMGAEEADATITNAVDDVQHSASTDDAATEGGNSVNDVSGGAADLSGAV